MRGTELADQIIPHLPVYYLYLANVTLYLSINYIFSLLLLLCYALLHKNGSLPTPAAPMHGAHGFFEPCANCNLLMKQFMVQMYSVTIKKY